MAVALPHTANGMGRWHAAERLYARGRWEEARNAYAGIEAVDARYQGFYLAGFILGDELFHRGPLYGHLRSEAIEPLQHALVLRPVLVGSAGDGLWCSA